MLCSLVHMQDQMEVCVGWVGRGGVGVAVDGDANQSGYVPLVPFTTYLDVWTGWTKI